MLKSIRAIGVSLGIIVWLLILGFLAVYYPKSDFGGRSQAEQFCYDRFMKDHPTAGENQVPQWDAIWIPFTPWFICNSADSKTNSTPL